MWYAPTCLIVDIPVWVDGAPEQGVKQVVLNIHLQAADTQG